MKVAWRPDVWWPALLCGALGLFLLREIWALASGRPQDTLSAWSWRQLAITADESILRWSAADYLIFGLWLTIISWLTWHIFFRRFT